MKTVTLTRSRFKWYTVGIALCGAVSGSALTYVFLYLWFVFKVQGGVA